MTIKIDEDELTKQLNYCISSALNNTAFDKDYDDKVIELYKISTILDGLYNESNFEKYYLFEKLYIKKLLQFNSYGNAIHLRIHGMTSDEVAYIRKEAVMAADYMMKYCDGEEEEQLFKIAKNKLLQADHILKTLMINKFFDHILSEEELYFFKRGYKDISDHELKQLEDLDYVDELKRLIKERKVSIDEDEDILKIEWELSKIENNENNIVTESVKYTNQKIYQELLKRYGSSSEKKSKI